MSVNYDHNNIDNTDQDSNNELGPRHNDEQGRIPTLKEFLGFSLLMLVPTVPTTMTGTSLAFSKGLLNGSTCLSSSFNQASRPMNSYFTTLLASLPPQFFYFYHSLLLLPTSPAKRD